jgi:hypothetical protein
VALDADRGHGGLLEREVEELVIKPGRGYGGIGVVICRDANAAAVEAARQGVRAHPAGHIAQRLVCLSTRPTVIEGRPARRRVDLRPYVFLGADGQVNVMPGGVTHVALQDGALIVNAPRMEEPRTPGSCAEGSAHSGMPLRFARLAALEGRARSGSASCSTSSYRGRRHADLSEEQRLVRRSIRAAATR